MTERSGHRDEPSFSQFYPNLPQSHHQSQQKLFGNAWSLSTPGRVSHMHTPSWATYLFLIVMNIGTGNTNSPSRENLSRVPLGRRKLQLSAARSVQRKREGHVYTLQNAFICTAFFVLPCYQLIAKTKKKMEKQLLLLQQPLQLIFNLMSKAVKTTTEVTQLSGALPSHLHSIESLLWCKRGLLARMLACFKGICTEPSLTCLRQDLTSSLQHMFSDSTSYSELFPTCFRVSQPSVLCTENGST